MARSFGVTVDFIDRELARFVRLGRLHCKIDRVGGIVETNRPDTKNAQQKLFMWHATYARPSNADDLAELLQTIQEHITLEAMKWESI